VVQEAKDRYLVRFVAEPGKEAHCERGLKERLGELYRGTVLAQRETTIAPEPSGKYRLARTELPVDAPKLFAEAA
jgi:hypothetical protein